MVAIVPFLTVTDWRCKCASGYEANKLVQVPNKMRALQESISIHLFHVEYSLGTGYQLFCFSAVIPKERGCCLFKWAGLLGEVGPILRT